MENGFLQLFAFALTTIAGLIELIRRRWRPAAEGDAGAGQWAGSPGGDLGLILSSLARLRLRFPQGGLQNLVVPIGESGSGKTTMVRFLTDDVVADNSESTMRFRMHGRDYQVRERRLDGRSEIHKVHVAVADYRGQNLGTLFQGLTRSPRRRGDYSFARINTLVFIVDLFPPPRMIGGAFVEDDARRPAPDAARIRHHLAKWSDDTLQIIFGSMNADALQSVCLFINKADLLSAEEARARSVEAYRPLIERLERYCASIGTAPKVILGSLKTGENCLELRDHVLKNAIPRRVRPG